MKNEKMNDIRVFDFKKKFGQNFLTDTNLLKALVKDAGVNKNSQILEIGMGAGALTSVLVEEAGKVVGFEIDKELKEHLQEKFENSSNITLVFEDALKADIKQIENMFENDFEIVANIPYYITTPLIFKFMEKTEKVKSQSLMVQKEVAERICAKENTSTYGALSVICQHHNNCKILRVISKKMFKPVPKVDSAFIKLEKKKSFDFEFASFVKNCFSMRRKTLANNIKKSVKIESQALLEIFDELKIIHTARAENLNPEMFFELFLAVSKKG